MQNSTMGRGFGFHVMSSDSSVVHDMSQFMLDESHDCSRHVRPALQKSKWSAEEDDLLRQNVAAHGLGNWSLVAQSMPGRNGKQCRERWMNQLSPSLNKDNWTPQEDLVLAQHQHIYGNVWSQIAQFLPGRSANAVKNRWSWLSRHSLSAKCPPRVIHFPLPRMPPPAAPNPVMPLVILPQRPPACRDPPDAQEDFLAACPSSADADHGWPQAAVDPFDPDPLMANRDLEPNLFCLDALRAFDDAPF
jgi:hypothetical protein